MIDVDYTKLALDLTDARRAALTATNGENDGGTCNFDAAAIRIPGSNTAKVQQAFAKADLPCAGPVTGPVTGSSAPPWAVRATSAPAPPRPSSRPCMNADGLPPPTTSSTRDHPAAPGSVLRATPKEPVMPTPRTPQEIEDDLKELEDAGYRLRRLARAPGKIAISAASTDSGEKYVEARPHSDHVIANLNLSPAKAREIAAALLKAAGPEGG
jgi:hypothetical protein